MSFDPLQPYAEIHGIPGVHYSQDGKSFNSQGREVTYRRYSVVDEGETVERVAVELVGAAQEPPPASPHANNKGDMHWTHLKALLAQFDEPYTTKEAALAFLKGKPDVHE